MTKKIKTTAPVSSVGADGAQPQLKNHTEIIANETAQINLQAVQNPEKSGSGRLQTVSMTELYDTVYPPRTPIVDGFLYGGTYLFVGAPRGTESRKIIFYGAACLPCGNGDLFMGLSRPKRDGAVSGVGRRLRKASAAALRHVWCGMCG